MKAKINLKVEGRDVGKMKGVSISADPLEPSNEFLCVWKSWSGNSRHS